MILPVLRGECGFFRIVVLCEPDTSSERTHPLAQGFRLLLRCGCIPRPANHCHRLTVAGDLKGDSGGFDRAQDVGAVRLEFAH